MKSVIVMFVSLLLLVSGGALYAEQATGDAAKAELDNLASKAFTEAVKVVNESGGFFPFAMVMRPDNTVQLIAYKGTQEDKPPAEEYVKALYWQLVKFLQSYGGYTSAIMLKPHVVVKEDGNRVPGIWALMDHRERQPAVAFLPFEQSDSGEWLLGEMVFSPAQNPLFRDAEEAQDTGAE